MTQPISLPARADTPSAPLGSKVSSHSPAFNSGIARVSWNDEERSPAKKEIEDYLFTYLWLHRASTKVEMRTSRRSAFVVCSSEEDAESIAGRKSAEVAGVAVRFSLVPLSSLNEDYSCSVLVYGMQLPEHNQEATFVSFSDEESPSVAFSHDKGDYDVLIINAQMALIFVDEQKKDQIHRLARVFSFSGVTNERAPSLTAFKMSRIPVEYRSEKALTRVFTQWKPNIVLCDDTAVITITDPSAVMGEVRACCESVAGRAVSIEYPSNLRDRLATDAVHRIRVDSLPPAKLAYFGSIRKDQNVSVRVDQDVLYIEGPKNACLEYERIVKVAFLHTVDSGLAPEVVSFLSTTPAKDNLKEVARSLQCACFAPDTSSATRLTIISESEADADTCKVQLKRRYTVDSTTSADHAILHTDAKDAWECMKDCIELDNPGVRILLEGNTVKLVGEQKGITSIQMYVREQISQFLVTDAVMELSKDHFEVMKHSSKWRDVVEDLEKQPDCKVIQHQSADPKGDVRIRVRGKPENMQKIQGRITEMRKSLVTKAVYVDRPGIQKIFRSDSCGPVHVSRPSPDCSALITCNSVQPLRDVFRVERGKLSSQRADALVNSSNDRLLLRNGQIAPDLAAVAGPALQRECSQYVKDHGPLRRGDVAVTGPGNLLAQCVIHGNVMTYSSRRAEESVASLQSVVQKALEECDSRRLQSIAFPAIGIGKLKFPVDVAVETLVSSAFDYLLQNRSSTSIKKVILVGLEERVHTLFLSKIEQRCGINPASVEPQHNHEDVHPTSGTVPDYPDLKLHTLKLDSPPKGTPPMGTPREFYILAESDYHCSQAEAELQQKVNEMIQRKVIEDETIKDLPTSFLTAFQVNAKAAHVKVMIHHNPTRAELLGPKEDVQHAVIVLEHALVAVANELKSIKNQVSSALQHYHWTYTSGPGGMTRPYSPGECYELEEAHQLQRKRVTFKREGSSEQVTIDMERCVEEGPGAAGITQVHRIQREEGFARPVLWEGQDLVVEVKKGSKEFEEVASEFESSVGCRVTIVKVERIQNHQLWQAYQANKQDVMQHTTTPERMLYHGCPGKCVDSINTNGFTARLAGTSNATAYGRGIYFARKASYSAGSNYSVKDSNGHKHIYRCCVLTGVFKVGRHDMRVPPPLNESTTKWCHSTVENEKSPSIFVIYENNRVYPQHLITFTECK